MVWWIYLWRTPRYLQSMVDYQLFKRKETAPVLGRYEFERSGRKADPHRLAGNQRVYGRSTERTGSHGELWWADGVWTAGLQWKCNLESASRERLSESGRGGVSRNYFEAVVSAPYHQSGNGEHVWWYVPRMVWSIGSWVQQLCESTDAGRSGSDELLYE